MADHLDLPGILTPAVWGSKVDYTATNWKPWMPDKWVFHWPGSPKGGVTWDVAEPPFTLAKSVAALQAWEKFHINERGWAGIAYNYAVDMAGEVFMLRGEQRSAATSGDQEPDGIPENHEARAVLFMVNTETDTLTDAMVAAVQQLWALDPGPVFGHKQISTTGTACPGGTVTDFITTEGYKPPPPTMEDTMFTLKQTKALGTGDGTQASDIAYLFARMRTGWGVGTDVLPGDGTWPQSAVDFIAGELAGNGTYVTGNMGALVENRASKAAAGGGTGPYLTITEWQQWRSDVAETFA